MPDGRKAVRSETFCAHSRYLLDTARQNRLDWGFNRYFPDGILAMHELAITESVIEAITHRIGDARVSRVLLEIGKLSGVVPDAVRFCFDIAADGTPLVGAVLDIIETPGRARCRECGARIEIDGPIALCHCGSANLEFIDGTELRIKEVEISSHV
jgi:hydrogenase nickel incorporation protein HypA/HybF